MANSGLRGSYPLTNESIKEYVSRTSAGAYALGYVKDNSFYVGYVGRSDNDVAARLHSHIGRYKRFKYEYYGSAKAAFEKECRIYHDFSPGGNKVHPDRPNGSGWKCPVCNIFQ
ncbi:MAG: hypothetical protein H6907_05105 [Hyphomicrobiales bacterium]|nr:hypothetical protein [Hyphomicrobiales bacterium]